MHDIARRAIDGHEPIEKLVEEFYGEQGPLRQRGWEVRSMQREMSLDIARQFDTFDKDSAYDDQGRQKRGPGGKFAGRKPTWGVVEAPCGCHAKGQGILMFDGTVKLVEDIVVGDLLMGPDSKPRMVLSLARGRERMVDVMPKKGATFRVNRSHILTLVRQGQSDSEKRADRRNGEIIDVVTSDVIDHWTRSRRELYRLIRAGVREFGGVHEPLNVPPWIVGALLGDGGFSVDRAPFSFTSVDPEVYGEVRDYVLSIGCQWKPRGDGRHFNITNIPAVRRSPIRTKMRAIGLYPLRCEEKYIPHAYKTASWDDRRELLAGLIDTDGSYNGCGGFDYISKSEQLSRDVAFVARSLGLAAYVTDCEKRSQTGSGGTYWRVSISGDCTIIPTRLARKRATERVINKDPLRTGFKLVEVDEEDFYGFELDGDGRFLLDDFTITHNTGKGLAYAVPGVLASLRCRARYEREIERLREKEEPIPPGFFPKKFVITTANIALQEQLVRKDLPALADMLGITDLRVSLLKGRNNYVCRMKVRHLGGAFNPWGTHNQILEWMRQPGCTGDKEALPFDPGESWADVSATTDECVGAACAHYGAEGDGAVCYWRQAIGGYNQAHVIVTNHHYLTLARGLTNCLLAVDEMHELESSLRSTQARSLTAGVGRYLARKLAPYMGEPGQTTEGAEGELMDVLDKPLQWLMAEAASHYDRGVQRMKQAAPNGRIGDGATVDFAAQWMVAGDEDKARGYVEGMRRLLNEVEREAVARGCFRDGDTMHPPRYSAESPERVEDAGRLAKLWSQLLSMVDRYEAVALGEPPPHWPGGDGPWALYFEQYKVKSSGEVRTVAQMCPADVSWATAALSAAYPVAVFTSATVPDFASLRLSLGLGTAPEGHAGAPAPTYEKRLPSPYPLREQGVLVVPAGPSPKDETWTNWAICTVVDAVKLARGRTLVLASSTRMMWQYFKALEDKSFGCGYPVKVQGSMGRGELREWFRTNEESGVLVATRSFFQGLDVQGDNCVLVIIDRVPFARPDDPVEAAVQKLLVDRAGGGSGYMLRSVPEAAMVLAQGAGRLIRSMTDRGAVLLLDKRVMSEGDGWRLLRAALPPFPVSRDLEDIARRLDGTSLAGVAPPPRARSIRRATSAP